MQRREQFRERGQQSLAMSGQYHLRERVGHALNPRVDGWAHPVTQVVLTSLRQIQRKCGDSG